MGKFCKNCGTQLNPNAKFCASCGAKPQSSERLDADGRARTEEKIAEEKTVVDQSGWANERYAEMSQNQNMTSPLGFLKASVKTALASFKQMFKNPKQLIPILVLSAFWLILSILPALDINPLPVKLISFLTFAQGGMYGGVLGAVGGVIGKAVFAYFVSALLLPLFSGKNPFRGMGGGFKVFFSGLAVKSVGALAPLLMGFGLALVLYNFFTGNAGLVNSMAGVVGFLLALRALLSKGGFIWGLLLTSANKLSNGKVPSQETVSHAVSGYAAGNALGVALSALSGPHLFLTAYLPYLVGVAFLVAGLVLGIAAKSKKEVAAA